MSGRSWLQRWEHDVGMVAAGVLGIALRAALVFAVVAAVALGALWGSHRWLGWSPPPPLNEIFAERVQQAEPLLYVYDNDMGWKLRPYTQLHWVSRAPFESAEPQDVRVRTNSEGFFDREHYATTDYYRIAFLGDSWVEAQQVDPAQRFTDLVEGYVYSQSGGKKAVETMNFGVGNLGPAQEYGLLRRYVARYKPDEIWIVFNPVNDITDSTQLFTAPPLGPTFVYGRDGNTIEDVRFGFVHPPAVNEALRRKRYGDWVNLTVADVAPYLHARQRHPAFESALGETRACLRLMKKLADSMGAKLVVAYLPARHEVYPEDWEKYRRSLGTRATALDLDPARGEQRIGEIVAAEGAEFFSLKPLMLEKGAREMLQGHLSRMGHHWVADAIARRVVASDCCSLPASAAAVRPPAPAVTS
ncbi:MAG TPA: hypothetical protein VM051_00290 [Usitatibacter sp.]|nr:hypothetical protein [Usitatibacter sp.]